MTLVPATSLAQYLGLDVNTSALDDALLVAEALVAQHLGADSLGASTGNTHTAVTTRARALFDLPIGPVTAITSVTLDGVTDTLSYWGVYGPWAAQRTTPIESNRTVVLTYSAGFSASSLPDAIKRGIILTAASIHNRPDQTVVSERIDNAQQTYAAGSADREAPALPPSARALLARWRRV